LAWANNWIIFSKYFSNNKILLLTSQLQMKIITLILFLIISSISFGQNYIGVFIEPALQLTVIDDRPEAISDSLNKINRPDMNLGFGIEYKWHIDRFNAISFSPNYQQFSSLFVLEDLQFLDIVHASLPEIRDLSQGAQKNAFVHNRFKHAGIHIQYSRSISDKFKSIGVLFEANGGLAYHFLVAQDAKITTEAFAINEAFTHVSKDNLFFEARKHNVSATLGATSIYNFAPDWQVFGNAMARIPVLSMTTNDPKVSIYNLTFRTGIRVAIN